MVTKFRVEAHFGGSKPTTADFDTENEAIAFAMIHRDAMPRWYNLIKVVKVVESDLHLWVK